MSYYVGVPLLFLAATAEASVLPLFRVAGLQPNLVLVLMVAWIMVRGREEALLLVPIGGLFLGLVDGARLGTAILALAPVLVLNELRGSHLRGAQLPVAVIFAATASVLYHLVYLAVSALDGAAGSVVGSLVQVAVPASFLNVVLLLPAYAVLWLASGDLRRAYLA